MIKGVLNINKPTGFTSQDVVSVVRGILKTRQIGHMGTLDPQGEGVLLLGIGKGTRLFGLMLKKDKVYRAEFDFGYETDTLDKDGNVLQETDVIPSQSQIESKLSEFLGEIDQIPPKYSAKNVNGVRAYDLAREGKSFDLKSCKVTIYDYKLIEKSGPNKYLFEISCSGGTYIRSLCRDLAYSLNSLATMTSIIRTKCGNFVLEDSVTLDELKEVKDNAVISLDDALSHLYRLDVNEEFYDKLLNGIGYDIDFNINEDFTVYCKNQLFGLGKIENGKVKIKTYLKD